MSTSFEFMTVAQVHARTASEGAVQRGKPLYADRTWTQVYDEMIDSDARTVGDLPPARIRALGAATRAQAASVKAGKHGSFPGVEQEVTQLHAVHTP